MRFYRGYPVKTLGSRHQSGFQLTGSRITYPVTYHSSRHDANLGSA